MRAALVLAALLPASTAAAGHGGVFVPPLRVDVGPAVSQLDDDPAFQCVAGIHWASVYPNGRARIDVGVGLVSTTHGEGDPPPGARVAPPDDALSLVGGYVEVATRTAGTGWWRTWVGTRVESGQATRGGERSGFVGVATRISTEAYVAGGSSGGSALVLGVGAIGVYGEVGLRRIDEVGDDVTVSAGLTMRVPLILGN